MTRSIKKKQAIINAAIMAFKQNGYKATSMDQIALSADVSKRTVYNHFASKELLFDAILTQLLTLFTTSIRIIYQPEKSLSLQLTDIAQQELSLLSDPAFIDLAKVVMAEAIHSPHRINEALAEVENRDGDLSSWITAAKKDGVLQVEDVDFAAIQFYALLKAFCFWPQVIQGQSFPDKNQQESIIASAVNMFIGLYQI